MARNPYSIDPSLDLSQGLQGLQTGLAFRQQRKDKEKKEDIRKGAVEVFRSGDPMAIAEYALQNPETAKELTAQVKFRDQSTKDNYINSSFKLFQNADNPEEVTKIVKGRQAFLKARGLPLDERMETDSFLERYNANPEETIAKLEKEIAFMAPKRYAAYKTALKGTDKKTSDITNLEYWQNLEKTDPDLADTFALATGFTKDDTEKSTAAMKNFNKYIDLLNTDPKQAKLFGDSIGIDRLTPHSDLAKLRTDLNNKLVTPEEYEKKRDKILNPTMKNKTELTMAALRGDAEAKAVLEEMNRDNLEMSELRSEATTKGKLAGLYGAMDLDAVANAIIAGEETIDHVHNTFGVPIQEVVRKKVLAIEPDFNFVQPRAIEKSLSSSLVQQQKNRGAMGNFVLNINGQLDKVSSIMDDVIKRIGVRALDVPFRELHVKYKGSGHERVLEAYMKEISVEIYKLSQGSSASVALLPEAGRKEWEKIHDFNLSYPQLKIVLEGTKDMANIRLKSVNDEIKATVKNFENIRELKNLYTAKEGESGSEFDTDNTITVTNPDTGEEEVWDLNTEKRVN